MWMDYHGQFAALGTAFCWSITAMAFEAAGKRVGSLAVNLIRLVMAGLLLSFACLILRGFFLPVDASQHAWFWLSISGIIGFAVGDLCLFRAFVIIGPRLSTLLMSLSPIFAVLIGLIVLGEVPVFYKWVGIAITLFGVSWVVLERRIPVGGTSRSRPSFFGVFLGLVGAAGQGGGLVLSKLGMGEYHPVAATQIRVFAGIAGFVILFFVLRWWPRVFAALRHRQAMGYTTIGAFFGPFLGVSLSLIAVRTIEAGVAQTIMSVIPVTIIPFVVVIHKEKVSPRAIVGAVIAVFGVAILFL